jgi:hypothetical protein
MFPKPFTPPGDDGPGLDEGECVLPASPETDLLGLEEPSGGMKAVVGRSPVGKRPTDVEAPRSAGAATGVNETGSQEGATAQKQ